MQKSIIDASKPQTFTQAMLEAPAVKDWMEFHRKHGKLSPGMAASVDITGPAALDLLTRKTATASGLGTATPGVMQFEMEAGIVGVARPSLRMRDVIPSRPTNLMRIAWLKESVRPTQASPVAEAGQKLLVDISVTSDYEDVKKIAIASKASDEVLADSLELEAFIKDSLIFNVQEEEDAQILSGAGTGNNLNGLTTQAQAWDLTILTASDGYEYGDMIAGAFAQIAGDNEVVSNPFVVLHPLDYWKIKRTKDSTGRYIYGDPTAAFDIRLWGALVVPTTKITQGYFLVGSGDPRVAQLRTRLGVTIDMATQHDTDFLYNLVTFRVELREALIVRRPNALVYGALTQSPA
jgi:HK97 family phage major capsid protein